MGFPMGALMFLETGGEVNYKPRLFTGVDPKYKIKMLHRFKMESFNHEHIYY